MFKDLMYIVTYRCNKKCDFCYNRIFDKIENCDIIEEKDINPLIDFLKRNNIERVSITGGEPTVRNDLIDLIKKIHTVSDVKIFTNGELFFKYNAQLLYESGVRKIVYTVTKENISNCDDFKNVLLLIDAARALGILVDGNAFLTSSYFADKEQIMNNNINAHFDNLRWQPLIYPVNNPNYEYTVYGMQESLRNEIFDDIIKENWGNISYYYKEFKRMFLKGSQQKPCTFPSNVITVNPDLSVLLCPHKKMQKFDFASIETVIENYGYKDCLNPECLGIYSFG